MEFILTSEGQHISPYAVIGILEDTAGVQQFKGLQRRDSSIEVSIRTNREDIDSVLRDVEQRCKRLFGSIPLRVKLADGLGQKLRFVESELTS